MPNNQIESIIELKNASVVINDYEMLKPTSLCFPKGKFSVVMGTAGSGKSTLLKACDALIPATTDNIFFNGKDVAKMNHKEDKAFRAATGFVFQDSALWSDMTIENNLLLPLQVHKPKLTKEEKNNCIKDIVSLLGYHEKLNLRPADLSSGEQKLISIARALIHNPEVIFMDDPTSNLDTQSKRKLFSVLEHLKNEHKTVIITTSHPELPFRFADYLGLIDTGSVSKFGIYDEVVDYIESQLGVSLYRNSKVFNSKQSEDDLQEVEELTDDDTPISGGLNEI